MRFLAECGRIPPQRDLARLELMEAISGSPGPWDSDALGRKLNATLDETILHSVVDYLGSNNSHGYYSKRLDTLREICGRHGIVLPPSGWICWRRKPPAPTNIG